MQNQEIITQGVYVGMELCSASKAKLEGFCAKNQIEIDFSMNSLDKNIHTTIILSPTGEADKITKKEISVNAQAHQWTVFKSLMTGQDCLVLKLMSPEIETLHQSLLEQYNLSHLYDTYQPHITLNYHYKKGILPETLPNFDITFETMYIRPLIHKKHILNPEKTSRSIKFL